MSYDQIQEIIFGLPSKNIMNVTRNLAVINPITDDLVILKQRNIKGLRSFKTELSKEDFEYYNESHNWDYEYNELVGKNILIDFRLLNNRGIKALLASSY